ncbi:NeuD/PglB/VioB family sugar acetyltransferase [Neptunicella sp. SCSIO 80796]|uniref:NeuD/PglB/VioB family sugar acetyltransferase n=1 Tax=Neptunicella plasticusilytica TaxID=3117012 RepID=UPI003A4D9FDA
MQVVLLGGGGHCKACIDVIESEGAKIAGFLAPHASDNIGDYCRLGDDSWLNNPDAALYSYLLAFGQTQISPARETLFIQLKDKQLKLHTSISPQALVSPKANVLSGSIIMHKAVVNAYAQIGENCIVNTSSVIEHDVILGSHTIISPGAILNGNVTIGGGSIVGSGAIVLPGINIAPNTIIGAGAVVTKDITSAGTWVGIPARRT